MASGIAEDELLEVKPHPWADNFFRPLLLTVMIMCFNIALVNLVRLFNPAWNGAYFLLGMLLTTVEAIYSYRVLKLYRSRGGSLLRYRLAEAAVLILLLKLLHLAGKPLPQMMVEVQALWQDPESFINLEFYVVLILAAVAWLAATHTMEDFEALRDPYIFRTDSISPLDELASRFFWGGGLLVLISGVTQWVARSGWSSLADWQRPSLGGVILNVLVYFTLGLAMLSQAHLTSLLLRWRIQRINVAPNLVKQWAKYGLIFLGLVLAAAFVLPTGYTLGFLASASILVILLIDVVLFLIQLLILLLTLPLAWLLSLLGQAPAERFSGMPELPVLPEPAPSAAPLPWLEALRSLIFWLLAAAIAGYFLKIYLADHPELVKALKRFKPLGFLAGLLNYLWQKLTGLAQAGLELLPHRLVLTGQGQNEGPGKYRRWAGLSGLSPRERILYYYLNIVERAARQGTVRQKHQTPFEFEPDLSQVVPEAQPAVNLLTQAFVRARYSQEAFEETQAGLVKVLWQQIRRALKTNALPGEPGPSHRSDRHPL
ncbi:MAG: DUF4129 domain-containing protein [Anaerolineae bacterium]|nr:DUF4129 domain-containing protein [Anaerolineae bacterium]